MPRVYCIHWSASDAQRSARSAGWSLHLSRADAAAYVATHEHLHAGHDEPRLVVVPPELIESVNAHRGGMFWATPLPCPFPVADAVTDREREVVLSREGAREPGGVDDARATREPTLDDEEREPARA